MGEPEVGYVSLLELATVRGKLGLPIERDFVFRPEQNDFGLRREGTRTSAHRRL